MSFYIHPELLTEQKKAAYEPSLYLEIRDNGLPHPRVLFDLSGQDNEPTCAVSTGTVILRARHNTGVGVEWQRITDPEVKSQWESWSLWDAGGGYPALFYTGVYLVLVWQDLGTKAVKWSRSSDGGVSWSAAQTIWTPAYFLGHLQVGVSEHPGDDFPGQRAGLFWASGSRVYGRIYNDTNQGDAWGAEFYRDLGVTVLGLGGVNQEGDDYYLAVALAGYVSTATRSLVLFDLVYDPTLFITWGTVQPYFDLHGGNASAYDIRHVSLSSSGSRHWLSFSLAGDTSAGALFTSTQVLASSRTDLRFFTSPVWLNRNVADRLIHLSFGSAVYLAGYSTVWKSEAVATVTADTSQILDYTLEDSGPASRLRLTLDNRSGIFAGLETGRLGANLVFERGALVGGVSRRVQREHYSVFEYLWSADNSQVMLTGQNYFKLLELWVAEYAYYRNGLVLGHLLASIAGLAGLDSIWSGDIFIGVVVEKFVIQAGQSALSALKVLAAQYHFYFRLTGDNILSFFTLSDTPTAGYEFGPAAHPTFLAEDSSRRLLPFATHIMVFGQSVGGEAISEALQSETGRQFTQFIRRRYVTSAAVAQTVAQQAITSVNQSVGQGEIFCLPAFQLQPLDAVEFDGWQDDQVRYISAIREEYGLRGGSSRVWEQRITLSNLAKKSLTEGAGAAFNLTAEEESSTAGGATEVKRADLLAFNPATWLALVRVEGSAAAVELPVGEWVPPDVLTVGDQVAVVLFDQSNPGDALVLGAYGGLGLTEWPPEPHSHLWADITDEPAFVLASDYEDADVLTKIKNVDGAASGLDADFLDGSHASAFAVSGHTHSYVATSDYEDSDVLTKIKNVDGAASGLDADLLDGSHASAFAAASHAHAAGDITSGTMATARLGSGSASSSTFLRGDQTWAAAGGAPADDAARVSKLYESDFGAVAWATDAAGNLTGNSTRDIFPQASTNGLNARFERLFGDDVPAHAYSFTRRTFQVNDFTNHKAGFEDSQASPYSFGGTPGGFSLTTPAASYAASSNTLAHWLFLQNYHASSPLYLQWTDSTAKTILTSMLALSPNGAVGASDVLVAEIRLWEVQSPGAADKYWSLRWLWLGSTRAAYPFVAQVRYGTGVTFSATDGTLYATYLAYPGFPHSVRLVTSAGLLNFYVYAAEGVVSFQGGASVASYPATFKTARFYVPPVGAQIMYVDDVVIT